MAENVALVINWYGPYPDVKSASVASINGVHQLYAAIGYDPEIAIRGRPKLLYVGISMDVTRRLSGHHHKLSNFHLTQVWIGEVAVSGLPGRRRKSTAPNPDFAEWMIAYFLQLPYNSKKTLNPPDRSGVAVNRWWSTDESESRAKPHIRWADVIEYNSYNRSPDHPQGLANLVWFGDRPRIKQLFVPLPRLAEEVSP